MDQWWSDTDNEIPKNWEQTCQDFPNDVFVKSFYVYRLNTYLRTQHCRIHLYVKYICYINTN